tara:strand:- start:5659 stop:6756 length:1098 start_codon:yes stop_codon:yes gene_type:complete
MRIAIDHQKFTEQKYGGITRYFACLALEISKLNQDIKIFAPLHINKYLFHLPKNIVSGTNIGLYNQPFIKMLGPVNNFLSQFQVEKYDPDIIHESYYSEHPIIKSICPRVITVHDMIHEKFPNEFSNDNTISLKKKSIERADHIITISNNTKNDLMKFYNISSSKITTIYHGATSNLSTKGLKPKKNQNYTKPYLLYVGNRSGYKNFNLLINAFGLSNQIKKKVNLIAFGGKPFDYDELESFNSAGLKKSQVIHITGDDNTLKNLYQNAEAFIFPSLYEGFGMPPLEAMSNNCPVISSNTSSMPEVIGDAGEYFNPKSVEGLINAIKNVLFSNRSEELVSLGQKRVEMFSWKKCAKETMSVYERL